MPLLTIGVDGYRKKEGLVQAHLQSPKCIQMVLDNITIELNLVAKPGCLQSQDAEVCQDVLS
jgi:hypothetical protein